MIIAFLIAGPVHAQAAKIAGFDDHHFPVSNGAPAGIRAIAQTPDGFLWLGSADGLYRFDGVAFTHIEPVDFDRFRSQQITALAVAKDGSLWVGYNFGGIAVYRDGHLRGANPTQPRGTVTDIIADPDGSMWVSVWSGLGSQLRHFKNGRWSVMDASTGLPAGPLTRIFLDDTNTLWMIVMRRAYRLPPGAAHVVRAPGTAGYGVAFAQGGAGHVWIYSNDGLQKVNPKKAVRYPVSFGAMIGSALGQRNLLIDDGKLWIAGDASGLHLVPLADPRTSAATLVNAPITALFRDREGTVWAGGDDGLYRFSRSAFVTLARIGRPKTGFATDSSDSSLYVAGPQGVWQIIGDKARLVLRSQTVLAICSVAQRGVYVMTGRDDYVLKRGRSRVIPRPPGGVDGSSCAVDAKGRIWQAVMTLGTFRLIGSRWKKVPHMPAFMQMAALRDGTMLGSRPLNLLARLQRGKVIPVWQGRQIGTGFVRLLKPADGVVYIGGEAGMARYDAERIRLLSAQEYPWLANVTGLVRRGHVYWIISNKGIFRVSPESLARAFDHPGRPIAHQRISQDRTVLPRNDGYVANDAAIDSSARLWFLTSNGVVRFAPERARRPNADFPVRIIRMEADGRTYRSRHIVLPAGTVRIVFSFVGLSLANAESNHYAYRLDGQDADWVDTGTRRNVAFSELEPGTYDFHVRAARAGDIWSRDEAMVTFEIRPYFWQTWWFRAFAALLIFAGVTTLVIWRLRTTMSRLRERLEERVAERERIARDLHDTLLQGFQGLILRFQSALWMTPEGSPARGAMEIALEQADDVLLQGRERVRKLREDAEPKVIADVLRQRMDRVLNGAMPWQVKEYGQARPVSAPVAEEIDLVVGEAVANAMRHAAAHLIEIEIHHKRDGLEVRIADNGIGLPPDILERGERSGHFGLPGMRERMSNLGGSLTLGNASTGGTSVRLRLPARIAYR